MSSVFRRLPVGAEAQPGGGVHFRVWAPDHEGISVLIERIGGESFEAPLSRDACGYSSGLVPDARAGDRYRFRFNGHLLADPASRFQPDGVFGPSQVIDPGTFRWSDHGWTGRPLEGQVIYEMHCGTFTAEGTWHAAAERLRDLVDVGITTLEVMPVPEFPGRFGWGYDGVFPYAPTRLYGEPDDLRAFIDRAHGLGLAVILDVVYNHLGPDGCVFSKYTGSYFTTKYENEWGEALNFDGPQSEGTREFFVANAGYWIDEFHFDGLRLDATQSIHDDHEADSHMLTEIGRQARAAGRNRRVVLIAENEPQRVELVRPVEQGGNGLDSLWNDDFHHSAVVALTGHREAYYSDHRGTPQELLSAAKYGYLFQGQRYAWQRKPRGMRADGLPPAAFVVFIENHDQVANSGDGARLPRKASPGSLRAMTALMLLMPGTPMLFQGQEFGSTRPFLYFADHKPELAQAVQHGRAEFVRQFPSLASPEMQAALAAPHDPATFERCKLDWQERERHTHVVRLHRDLLQLRRSEEAFRRQTAGGVDGAVLGPEAFLLRFAASRPIDERLLLVNLGADVTAQAFPEPLLAPPDGCWWELRWSSEHPDYGGAGTPPVVADIGWRIPGHAAVVLSATTES